MTSNKFSYASEYFNNFDVNNGSSPENILTYINTSGASANNSGPQSRWCMTMHYNQYTPKNPNAGWNGFSTIGDFYTSFGTTASPATWLRITVKRSSRPQACQPPRPRPKHRLRP